MKLMHIFSTAFAVFLLLFACGKSNEQANAEQNSTAEITPTTQETSSVSDENGWYNDWDAGIKAANSEKKPVLVDFTAGWCKWCKVMEEKTFSDPEIKKTFTADWITIRIDTEDAKTQGTFKDRTLTYRELAGSFGVTGLPSFLFLDKNGEPITVISGYKEKKEFGVILDFFKDEIYKEDEATQKEFLQSRS